MELLNLPMFGLMRERMNWLTQRQQVLAGNIANADTPDFVSRDIEKFDFKRVIRRSGPSIQRVSITLTNGNHIAGSSRGSRASSGFKEIDNRRPYETSPNGNEVILEEQMIKMNEVMINHDTMTRLYRKNLQMLRTVTRSGGGR